MSLRIIHGIYNKEGLGALERNCGKGYISLLDFTEWGHYVFVAL